MLSKDLTELMPDIRSFSVTNLKYMRYFYETFPDAQNRPQLVDDLDTIFMIPWGHYRYILASDIQRYFYSFSLFTGHLIYEKVKSDKAFRVVLLLSTGKAGANEYQGSGFFYQSI